MVIFHSELLFYQRVPLINFKPLQIEKRAKIRSGNLHWLLEITLNGQWLSIFHSKMLNYQRISHFQIPSNQHCCWPNPNKIPYNTPLLLVQFHSFLLKPQLLNLVDALSHIKLIKPIKSPFLFVKSHVHPMKDHHPSKRVARCPGTAYNASRLLARCHRWRLRGGCQRWKFFRPSEAGRVWMLVTGEN